MDIPLRVEGEISMWCNLILLISANINLVESVSCYCLASLSAAAAQFSLSQFTAPGFSV